VKHGESADEKGYESEATGTPKSTDKAQKGKNFANLRRDEHVFVDSANNCALAPPNRPFYRDDHLFVDLRDQVVLLDSETVTLTRKEYRLLALLVQHVGEVVPRAILLMHIWGYGPEARTRTLDMHIRKLRKKLGMQAQYIETIVGVGYRFRQFHGKPAITEP
jgi:DNA-binding response OmpR family regulator